MNRDRRGIVIKTHERDAWRYERVIHLVRSPFDAIESFFHYLRDVEGKDVDWTEHVELWSRKWGINTRYWMQTSRKYLRVRYEDLHEDTESTLAEILSWLRYDVAPFEIAASVEKCRLEKLRKAHKEFGQAFFRRGTIGTSLDAYGQEQIDLILDRNGDVLEKVGYTHLLELHSGRAVSI